MGLGLYSAGKKRGHWPPNFLISACLAMRWVSSRHSIYRHLLHTALYSLRLSLALRKPPESQSNDRLSLAKTNFKFKLEGDHNAWETHTKNGVCWWLLSAVNSLTQNNKSHSLNMNWQNGGEFILFHPFQLKKQDGHFFCQHWALVHSPPPTFLANKKTYFDHWWNRILYHWIPWNTSFRMILSFLMCNLFKRQ